MILGKHVSIAGGIDKAPARARELGCNALQVFSKNPRGWKARHLGEDEVEKITQNMDKYQMKKLVVHATYLINIASPNKELRKKSIDGLREDYYRAGLIKADYLVLHPGSHTGSGYDKGIEKIIDALNLILDDIENETLLLLENVAGSGTTIGSNFNQIHGIIEKITQKERVGFCLDTCHAFAAGYDLRIKDGLDLMLEELNLKLGLNNLKMIHINDSVYELNSKKDEHAHIGKGKIGLSGMKEIINHPDLKDLPFILETPEFDGIDEDVELLYSLREG